MGEGLLTGCWWAFYAEICFFSAAEMAARAAERGGGGGTGHSVAVHGRGVPSADYDLDQGQQ